MIDPTVGMLIAFALLLIGVASTFIPFVPGGAISFSGVYVYWWSTGYTMPSDTAMVLFGVAAAITVFLDYFGGAIATKMGGAGTFTVFLGMGVGFAGLITVGPLGLLVGFPLTVFTMKFIRTFSLLGSLRTTVFTLFGLLGSNIMQLFLTGAMFFGFISLFVNVSPI